jgi:hypothetical protein
MRHIRRHRAATSLLVALGLLATAGAAWAFWKAGGSGSGAGSASNPMSVSIAPAAAGTALFPGASADVTAIVTNPNGFRVRVAALALDTTHGQAGFDVDGAHSGCSTAALSYTTQSAGWWVAAHDALTVTLSGAVSLAPSAASACQGATFTVYLRAS